MKPLQKALSDAAAVGRGIRSHTVPNLLGGPVDLFALGLNAAGVPVGDQPVGGSRWIYERLKSMGMIPLDMTGEPLEQFGGMVGGLFAPSAMQGAGRAAFAAEQNARAPTPASSGPLGRQIGSVNPRAHVVDAPSATAGRVSKSGRYGGAPPGVDSPAKHQGIIRRYQNDVEAGEVGRDWYTDFGREIASKSPDPVTSRSFADAFANTSSQATVPSNFTFAVQGHNQAVTGAPVRTGRYPQMMSGPVQEAYSGSAATGLKRSPFANNIALGGGFSQNPNSRPVHDMWTAASVGYPNKTIPGDAGHAYMDRVVDQVIGRLNRAAYGGHRDWNHLNTQAANWIGARMRKGDMSIEDAGRMPSTLSSRYDTRLTQEVTPGSRTGHLPELLKGGAGSSDAVRQEYADELGAILNPGGRNAIADRFRAMSGPAVRHLGVYEGDVNPGTITNLWTAPPTGGKTAVGKGVTDPGERALQAAVGPADRKLVEAVARTHDMLTQQNAFAAHKVTGEGGPRSGNMAYVPHPNPTPASVRELEAAVRARYGEGVLPVSTDGGRVGLLNAFGPDDFPKRIAKDYPDAEMKHAVSMYREHPWGEAPGSVTRDYLSFIDDPAYPKLAGAAEGALRDLAPQILAQQTAFAKKYGMTTSELVENFLRLASKGDLKALAEAAAKGTVPAVVGGVLLRGQLAQPPEGN